MSRLFCFFKADIIKATGEPFVKIHKVRGFGVNGQYSIHMLH